MLGNDKTLETKFHFTIRATNKGTILTSSGATFLYDIIGKANFKGNFKMLIVDSWTSFKDHASMQKNVPRKKALTIKNIPAGATPQVQPLDVFFF